ncbi:hypothetical protein LJB42_003986 [Komagataella kurtzmanii]|nr:hypothetical protein LJB42_003986 [Komagataella kurtzmanii]
MSTNEHQFLLKALEEGLRLDGRKPMQVRPLNIEVGPDYGQVLVTLGDAKVVVRISSEIVTPYEDRPFEGIFQVSSELDGMGHPSFNEASHRQEEEVMLSRLIEKAIRRSNALDLESLCIIAGQKCWSVRADVHIIDYDGNMTDIVCIGVIAGLLHFKKPDISIRNGTVILHDMSEREPVPLSVLHIPICVTFQIYSSGSMEDNVKGDGREFVIVDATLKEEALTRGTITLTLNSNKELCQMSKSGGINLEVDEILSLTNEAQIIVDDFTKYIKDTIKKDEELRVNPRQKELQVVNSRE